MVDCVADHLPVVLCAQVNCKISQNNQAINRRRNYSNQNILNLMEELQSMETSTISSCRDANDTYTEFISKYTEVFNNCFPFRNQTKKHKTKKAVWYDAKLRETYKSKQLLYKKYMREPNETNKKKLLTN